MQDDAVYTDVLNKMDVPVFKPLDGVKIATTEAEAKEENNAGGGGQLVDVDSQCALLLEQLPKPAEMANFR